MFKIPEPGDGTGWLPSDAKSEMKDHKLNVGLETEKGNCWNWTAEAVSHIWEVGC